MALVPAGIKALPLTETEAISDLRGRSRTMKQVLTSGYDVFESYMKLVEANEPDEKLVLIPHRGGYFEIGRPNLNGVHVPQLFIRINEAWNLRPKAEFIAGVARIYDSWLIEMAHAGRMGSLLNSLNELESIKDAVAAHDEAMHQPAEAAEGDNAKLSSCSICKGETVDLGVCCQRCFKWTHLQCAGLSVTAAKPNAYMCDICRAENG